MNIETNLNAQLANGLKEIESAATEADVIAARKKAVSAMEKVPTIGQSSETGEVGKNFKTLFPEREECWPRPRHRRKQDISGRVSARQLEEYHH